MKKIFFVAILSFWSLLIYSQAEYAFNNNYALEWQYDCTSMIMVDSNYYISGNIARNSPECAYWLFGYHVSKINPDGIKDTTIYYDKCNLTVYTGWKGCMGYREDTLVSVGMISNEIDTSKVFVLGLSKDNDTLFNYYYLADTLVKRCFSFAFTHDANIVLCGGTDSTYNELSGLPETTFSKSYLLKTTTNGEVLWSKSYSYGSTLDGCWSSFYRVLPTFDKGFITLGVSGDYGSHNHNMILKTDSLGNQQWVRFYGNYSYDNPAFSDIITTHDSCFLVCGSYTYGETFGGLYPYDGWLVKVDINGNTKWEKKYRDYVLNNTDWRDTINCKIVAITELSDHGFAGIVMGKSNQCLSEEFSIYRFDSIGNLLWKKLFTEFPECTIAYHPNTIIQTDDLGFAIGGHTDHYEWNSSTSSWDYSQRLFLIKTDSLGNDTLLSNITPYEAKPITKFDLVCYPNPANSEFFVDLPQDFEDDVLEIYSTSGSLVYAQTVGYFNNRVDINNLKSGMYLLKLREKGSYGKLIIE